MTDMHRDPVIDRVRGTLRSDARAAAEPQAVGRLLHAVWAAPRPSLWRRTADAWRSLAITGLGASAVAAAALVIGFVSRGAVSSRVESEPAMAAGSATGTAPGALPVTLASAEAGEARVATQFVFERAGASSVSLVGEFNDWGATDLPMTQVTPGVWEATVPLLPGRHVYAFLVDGTLLVADPRAPKAGDADYGREGSVVMVFAR